MFGPETVTHEEHAVTVPGQPFFTYLIKQETSDRKMTETLMLCQILHYRALTGAYGPRYPYTKHVSHRKIQSLIQINHPGRAAKTHRTFCRRLRQAFREPDPPDSARQDRHHRIIPEKMYLCLSRNQKYNDFYQMKLFS